MVNVISTSPKEDSSKVEGVKMLTGLHDAEEKTDKTTMDSTDKTYGPIITDSDCQAQKLWLLRNHMRFY